MISRKFTISTLALLFLINLTSLAQISYYKQYTVNNGLPGSVVYDLAQDSKGYIWIATEYGVSRYDGYQFVNYTTRNGLASNSIILIFEGKPGYLWFYSYSGELSYMHDQQVTPFPLNDTLEHLGGRDYAPTLSIDQSNNIWFRYAADTSKAVMINASFKISIRDTSLGKRSNFSFLFKNYHEKNSCKGLISGSSKMVSNDNYLYALSGNYYYLDENDRLNYAGNKLTPGLNYVLDSTDIYCEENGKIWLRKKWDGVYLYEAGHPVEEPLRFLPDMRVTKILKDRDKNYWLATEGNGVYFVPSVDYYVYDQRQGLPNANIISMEVHGNNLYFGTNDGKLYVSRLNQQAHLTNREELLADEPHKYCRDILYQTGKEALWVISTKYLRYHSSAIPMPLRYRLIKKSYEFFECSNGNILVAMIEGFVSYDKNELVYDSRSDGFVKHVRTIYQDKRGVIWLGAMDGLYSYDGKNYTDWGDSLQILNKRITTIQGKDNEIWVGSRADGIVVIGTEKIRHINQSKALSSNMIRAIHFQPDGTAWVGTIDGLNKLVFEKESKSYIIRKYSVWDGLPSNEINDIKAAGKYLLLATNFGLCTFNPDEINKKEFPPLLHINEVSVNNIKMQEKDSLLIGDTANSILIEYAGINYDDPGNLEYRYKISWKDKNHSPYSAGFKESEEWTKTRNTSLRLNAIPGDYRIMIEAINRRGVTSETPAIIQFTVNKPLSQQLWLHIFILFLAIAAVSLIFFIILRNRKRKQNLKTNLILSEQKALRAQMNPHFIFNSLNSIQNFILDRDDQKADLYLANFSSLMRRVLENSRHNQISLADELETLRIYLELEHLRFENKFEFAISVTDDIEQEEIFIPPSIIQPYLENAIWHGLMPSGENGMLLLKVKKYQDNLLRIIIEDNGIGREASAKMRKKSRHHKSTGMKNIEERLELLNKTGREGYAVEIEDLKNKEGTAAGTRIILSIPFEHAD